MNGLLPVSTFGQEPHKQSLPSLLAHCTWAPPSTSLIGVLMPGTHCIGELLLPGGDATELIPSPACSPCVIITVRSPLASGGETPNDSAIPPAAVALQRQALCQSEKLWKKANQKGKHIENGAISLLRCSHC